MRKRFVSAALLLGSLGAFGETLGYVEQKFNSINFERAKWDRSDRGACFLYTARETNALVEIMRFGTSNLVAFRASKAGLTVTICGSTAAFDEGFEAHTKS